MPKKPKPVSPKEKTGPKAETLKLPGSWVRSVKQSLLKKRPVEGWPKVTV